jgi:hypothetical protein
LLLLLLLLVVMVRMVGVVLLLFMLAWVRIGCKAIADSCYQLLPAVLSAV